MFDRLSTRSVPLSTVVLVGASFAGLGLLVGMALDRMVSGNSDPASSAAASDRGERSGRAVAEPRHGGEGLGISRERLQAALDSPIEPRFKYDLSSSANGQDQVTGRLTGDRVLVELEGPADEVARACLLLQLVPQRVAAPKGTDVAPPAVFQVPDSVYMVLLARALAPSWQDCSRWLEGAVADAASGAPASVSQGGVRFTLSRLDKFGVLMFAAEPTP